MLHLQKSLFEGSPQAIVCPINRVVKVNGDLVMGAGLAKEFAARWPFLPKAWGQQTGGAKIVATSIALLPDEAYHEIPVITLVGLPTKIHWKNPSDLSLIVQNVQLLASLTEVFGWTRVHLPRLGCGCGGLDWTTVRPAIEPYLLGDSFIVCYT